MLNSKITLYYENEHFTIRLLLNIQPNIIDIAEITLNVASNHSFMKNVMKYDMIEPRTNRFDKKT